jgi:flavin reductase (DIM6/NTAB) family NADH-FMN oxidoreductase RutF
MTAIDEPVRVIPRRRELPSAAGPAEVAAYKELMSTFPSGVAVVTTIAADGSPRGLTCSSLTSVTIRPPTLLVCVHNSSGTLDALLARGLFAVNLLHGRGRAAAEMFASGRPDRFGQVDWCPTPAHGLPHLAADAHAVAECRVARSLVVGEHTVVLGEVLDIRRHEAPPLLYGTRRFGVWSPLSA